MVSFASPLFWQIHYLVSNLSKKNFKTNVAELNQVRDLLSSRSSRLVSLSPFFHCVLDQHTLTSLFSSLSHPQLVGLYGEDARIFLLNCLVKDIDFRDDRNQTRDALKIQLLAHEIAQASSRPNFTTFLCEVRPSVLLYNVSHPQPHSHLCFLRTL